MVGLCPGQVWWDKDYCWTDGSKELQQICLLLSVDNETFLPSAEFPNGEAVYLYKVAKFIWCRDNYMGARVCKFTEDEVRKMYLVGNVSQIKDFAKK